MQLIIRQKIKYKINHKKRLQEFNILYENWKKI